jgi:hypothetical protein
MNEANAFPDQPQSEQMLRLVVDALRRIVLHHGMWFAQVEHQLGLEAAFKVEEAVWQATLENQMGRIGKTLGFSSPNGIPDGLRTLPEKTLSDLIQNLAVNWLANDGIWFQAVEKSAGMNDAKRVNDTCWTRYSPYEARRIKILLGLSETGGLPALKKALAYRMYAFVNTQSIEDLDGQSFIFRMNDCRVQSARKRKGLADYPCKSVGLVEYPYFARAIDSRIVTHCVACPPDDHPKEWFCAWKFTIPEG